MGSFILILLCFLVVEFLFLWYDEPKEKLYWNIAFSKPHDYSVACAPVLGMDDEGVVGFSVEVIAPVKEYTKEQLYQEFDYDLPDTDVEAQVIIIINELKLYSIEFFVYQTNQDPRLGWEDQKLHDRNAIYKIEMTDYSYTFDANKDQIKILITYSK